MNELKTGYFEEEIKVDDRLMYLSNSKMQSILDDPGKFFGQYSPGAPKRKSTAAMDWGRLMHLRALEPEKYKTQVKAAPIFKGKGSKAAKEEWELTKDPNEIYSDEDEMAEIEKAFDGLMRNKYAKHLIERSTKERHGYAKHPQLGLWLYSRPDIHTEWQNTNWVTDYKTCSGLDDESIKMALYGMRYYAQVMFYVIVDEIINGITINEGAATIFHESKFPYNARVIGLDPLWQGMGRIKFLQGATKYQTHRQMNPGCDNPSLWALDELGESSPEYWMLRKDPEFAPLMSIGESTMSTPI